MYLLFKLLLQLINHIDHICVDTLEKLDRQWLLLVDRIGQRKSLLDVLVSDWSRYRESRLELNAALDIVESTLSLVSVNSRVSINEAVKLRSILKVY